LRALLEEGQVLANAIGDRRARLRLSMVFGRALCGAGDVAEYLELALENQRESLGIEDIAVQANAWVYLVDALCFAARLPEALRSAEEGLSRFPRHIPSEEWFIGANPYTVLSFWRGVCLNLTGRLREALEELGRSTRLSEEDGAPEVACSHGAAAEVYYRMNDAARAITSARQAEQISRKLGDPPTLVAYTQTGFAYAHLAAGRAADAIEAARRALELNRRVEKVAAGFSATLLAEALLQDGDFPAAETAAAEAIALCRRSSREVYEAVANGVLARALLRREGASARDAAEAALAEAAALIERSGAKALAPALCEWRAELVSVLGDDATRAKLLQEALQGYEEIGAPSHAERLRKELGR